VYDLSQPLADGIQTYPGDPEVDITAAADFETDGYRVTAVRLGSHAGTHIDAPAHTEVDGNTLGAFPIHRFEMDTMCIDCQDLGPRDRIPPDRVPDVDADAVAFHTGWDDHWGAQAYYDHPFLAQETAEKCVNRGLDVALDTLSPDPTPSPNACEDEPEGFKIHHELLGNECLVIENLRGLDQLPETFALRVYPLALDGDGAPVRAVAATTEHCIV